MGLVLQDISPFNISSPIPHALIQVPVHCFNYYWSAGLIQGNCSLFGVKILILYLFPRKKINNNLLGIDSKRRNEIKYQGLFVVIVCVLKPHIWVETGQDTGLLNKRV